MGKFSLFIRIFSKKRVSSQGFYKFCFTILRSEFALEHLLVEAFWVLFSGTICMIFFNHCFVYLISGNVIVTYFPHSALFLLKMWYIQSHSDNVMNSIFWSFVSGTQHHDYYSATSFLNVSVPLRLKVICRPCFSVCNLVTRM